MIETEQKQHDEGAWKESREVQEKNKAIETASQELRETFVSKNSSASKCYILISASTCQLILERPVMIQNF